MFWYPQFLARAPAGATSDGLLLIPEPALASALDPARSLHGAACEPLDLDYLPFSSTRVTLGAVGMEISPGVKLHYSPDARTTAERCRWWQRQTGVVDESDI